MPEEFDGDEVGLRPRQWWRRIKKLVWTVAFVVLVVIGYRFLQRQVAIAELSRLGARIGSGGDLPDCLGMWTGLQIDPPRSIRM